MNRTLLALTVVLTFSTAAVAQDAASAVPAGPAGGTAAQPASPRPTWTKVVDGVHAAAYVHDGVGVPALVYEHLRALAPNQVTVLMRSCSNDGTASVKVEHLRGREGTTRDAIVEAIDALASSEDSAAAAEVLDYALVIGMGAPGLMTTTLRVFQPETRPLAELLPERLVEGERVNRIFPALGVSCPAEATTVEQAVSMRGIVDTRFVPTGKGVAGLEFGADSAAAVRAFNEVSEVLAAVQLPNHILGLRQHVGGQAHIAQASKWSLPGGHQLMLVLESKSGQWSLRAQ